MAWLESQHINYHSFPKIAPTTIPSSSSSLLTMRQRRFRASSNQSKTSFHSFATRQHLCPPHCDHDSCHCCVQYDWPRMQRQFSYLKKMHLNLLKRFNCWLSRHILRYFFDIDSNTEGSIGLQLRRKKEGDSVRKMCGIFWSWITYTNLTRIAYLKYQIKFKWYLFWR